MTILQPAHPAHGGDRPGLPKRLPGARGPITEQLLGDLGRRPHEMGPLPLGADPDPLHDDDAALALYLCYEQHYLGLPGVDERWEWNPSLLRERHRLEQAFEDQLIDLVGPPPVALRRADVKGELTRLSTDSSGPSLSGYMERSGTVDQLREFAVHRSAYQLKEADPHTWAIPRLTGRAKAALVEIQRGEYGDGVVEDVHANLFAAVLQELRLDASYGAYVDRLPAVTLATCNLVSMFGLHRRWRGALIGHLALFEMCSVGPMGRYANAVRRLGHGDPAARFYEAHVLADERHQVVALDEMVDGLVRQEPFIGGDVVFGARALAAVERLFAASLLDAWAAGRSSLRPPT
ncbi:MAG: iron-containing redox enzyme family protein [Acidimicrobiales bacterium]